MLQRLPYLHNKKGSLCQFLSKVAFSKKTKVRLCKQLAKNAVFQGMRCSCPENGAGCLRALLAEWDGKLLNASAFGRQLGVAHSTAMSALKRLAQQGDVRILPSFDRGRRPLLYVAGSLLGSWVEAVVAEILKAAPESGFFWWKTRRVRQIHLLADTGRRRLGFCFSPVGMPQRKDRFPLHIACRRGLIHNGYVLHSGSGAWFFRPALFELPFADFVRKSDYWINPQDPWTEVRRINLASDAALARLFSGT